MIWGDGQKTGRRTAAEMYGGGFARDIEQLAEQGVTPETHEIRWPVSKGNPKDVEAQRTGKPRLDLLEPVAEREIAKALAFGADKYGVRNYATAPINARVYVAAMKRHIDAWLEGEDNAEDSGAHHLGHIGANVHVALAAIHAGTFIDDRAATAAKDASISDPAKVDE